MRIRSALAAAALGVALTAAAAASATAHDGHRHYDGGDGGKDAVCSPYFGAIDTSSSDIVWGGAHCEDGFFSFRDGVNRHHDGVNRHHGGGSGHHDDNDERSYG
ncbi:hypothetical protein ACIBBD_01255 [Streptomyces sp. NPDC051315]|uniref:hypothetical protein n=1 Tax=Streptomyces sp. NPDC051315 TaxID=3365650 RepID=UPI0037A8152D